MALTVNEIKDEFFNKYGLELSDDMAEEISFRLIENDARISAYLEQIPDINDFVVVKESGELFINVEAVEGMSQSMTMALIDIDPENIMALKILAGFENLVNAARVGAEMMGKSGIDGSDSA